MRLKTSTPRECRQALSRIVNMTINGSINIKSANCAIYGINSILAAIRTDEQERRINELEKLLEVQEYEKN